MNRSEIVNEIKRVEQALAKTKSDKLRRDYGKYLKRLCRELNYYDNQMDKYQQAHA